MKILISLATALAASMVHASGMPTQIIPNEAFAYDCTVEIAQQDGATYSTAEIKYQVTDQNLKATESFETSTTGWTLTYGKDLPTLRGGHDIYFSFPYRKDKADLITLTPKIFVRQPQFLSSYSGVEASYSQKSTLTANTSLIFETGPNINTSIHLSATCVRIK